MQIIIREAQTTDAAALIEHVRQIAAEPDIDVPLQAEEFTMTVAEEEQIIQEIADSDNSLFLVAEHRGQIVGHLSCRGGKRQAMRHATELGISIQRSWRGQGIGGQLMEAAIAWAKPSTIVKRIELKVYARNRVAIHLYEKFGFQVEGRRKRAIYHNREYLDDFIMALQI